MSGFRCVAIETGTPVCSVAVSDGDTVEVLYLEDSRSSSRQLYRSLRQLLGKAGLEPASLDCVAFGCGPGSFTGLRVAAGAAQALAFSLNIPVCPVSSLAALAWVAQQHHPLMPVAACLDARMGEIYFGLYDRDENGHLQPVQPDCMVKPEDFRFAAAGHGLLAAGNGWEIWPVLLENNRAAVVLEDFSVWPTAGAVIALARQQYSRGQFVAPAEAVPNYLRDQVTQ